MGLVVGETDGVVGDGDGDVTADKSGDGLVTVATVPALRTERTALVANTTKTTQAKTAAKMARTRLLIGPQSLAPVKIRGEWCASLLLDAMISYSSRLGRLTWRI